VHSHKHTSMSSSYSFLDWVLSQWPISLCVDLFVFTSVYFMCFCFTVHSCRLESSLSNKVRTFQVANRSGFRIDVHDLRPQERDAQRVRLPVRQSKERTMFGPPFLGPSYCEVSSAVPEKGCSVALEAADRVCRSSPRPPRPSHQGRQRSGYRLEAGQSHLEPAPVACKSIAVGLAKGTPVMMHKLQGKTRVVVQIRRRRRLA